MGAAPGVIHTRWFFVIRKLFLVRHGTLHILSWWAEPIHIWIWMPNMKNVTTIDPNKDISKTRQVHVK
jgi:hypothetical protein